MSDRADFSSPDEQILFHALERLRTREGLTLQRIRAHQDDVAAPLVRLAGVRRYATAHEVGLPEAVLAVMRAAVGEPVLGSDRVVADAVLGLNTFEARYLADGIERQVVWAVSSDALGRRRQALLAAWGRLHRSLGVDPVPAPSDRQLRGPVERQTLLNLARLLVRLDVFSLTPRPVPPRERLQQESDFPITPVVTRTRGRVVVVGGAVMDAVFRGPAIPQPQTSQEAHTFRLSPGGKGLTQAIAAARLGLDVAFVGAVAGDSYGDQIIALLTAEGVDTSMVKHVHGERTPFTAVVENDLGESLAANWRNEAKVGFGIRDVEAIGASLIDCDALLVSFELPRRTVEHILSVMPEQEATHRPVVIVTPGQPYRDGRISRSALARIDYLVAHPWELMSYRPDKPEHFDVSVTCNHLLGVLGNVCIPQGTSCVVYSDELGTFQTAPFPSFSRESSVARDAFCAALAARLIESGGAFSMEQATWAAAALGAADAEYPLPRSVPDRRRIELLVRRAAQHSEGLRSGDNH